jgi:hypothetical protein
LAEIGFKIPQHPLPLLLGKASKIADRVGED